MKRNTVIVIMAVVLSAGTGYWTLWGSPESPQQLMKIFNGIEHGRTGWVDFKDKMYFLPRPVQERLTSYLVQNLPDQALGEFIRDNIDGDRTEIFFSKPRPASGELVEKFRQIRFKDKEWNSLLQATSRKDKELTALALVPKMPQYKLYGFVFAFHEKCGTNNS